MNVDERIRQRAYEIWEAEGRPEGQEADHWQRARDEIEPFYEARQRRSRRHRKQRGHSDAEIGWRPIAAPAGRRGRGTRRPARICCDVLSLFIRMPGALEPAEARC